MKHRIAFDYDDDITITIVNTESQDSTEIRNKQHYGSDHSQKVTITTNVDKVTRSIQVGMDENTEFETANILVVHSSHNKMWISFELQADEKIEIDGKVSIS